MYFCAAFSVQIEFHLQSHLILPVPLRYWQIRNYRIARLVISSGVFLIFHAFNVGFRNRRWSKLRHIVLLALEKTAVGLSFTAMKFRGLVMIRKLAILLAVIMVGFLAWQVFGPRDVVSIRINGQEIMGPFDIIGGVWGLIVAAVTLFCVAILLAFVFAGVALLLLGVFALVGLVLLMVAFPFLLPILIPLSVIWLFCLLIRSSRPRPRNA